LRKAQSQKIPRRQKRKGDGFVVFVSKIIIYKIMLKPKYFLYARKSTEDDDHQIMSIEAQLFELREYARRENLEIIAEFQEAKSAKKPGREMFAEMINEIEKSDGVGILSWHPDRLARNSVDGGKIIYLVDTQKNSFFALSDILF
jgi:DNA invertase Pin-like site-specific DNA recombinase